ncbi:MAG: hypothetical protein R2817_08085 [Flavobacteriales bacterium]
MITTRGLFNSLHRPGTNIQLLSGATVQAVGLLAMLAKALRHAPLRALLDN